LILRSVSTLETRRLTEALRSELTLDFKLIKENKHEKDI
jgi:hypothetical protein